MHRVIVWAEWGSLFCWMCKTGCVLFLGHLLSSRLWTFHVWFLGFRWRNSLISCGLVHLHVFNCPCIPFRLNIILNSRLIDSRQVLLFDGANLVHASTASLCPHPMLSDIVEWGSWLAFDWSFIDITAIIGNMCFNDPLEVNYRWSFPSTSPLGFKLLEEQELGRYCARNVSAVTLGLRGLIGDWIELKWVFNHRILCDRWKSCEGRSLAKRCLVHLVVLRALPRFLGFRLTVESFTRLILLLFNLLFQRYSITSWS